MVTISSSANRHFQRGRSIYTCSVCGRRTRETTVSGSDLCADCFELAGLQNTVWDGCFTEEDRPERDAILGAIQDKGGNVDAVKAEYRALFDA